jgi:hypothetical protein
MVTAGDHHVDEFWTREVGGDACPAMPIDIRSLADPQGRRTEPA